MKRKSIKNISLLLIILIISTLALTGCGGSETSEEELPEVTWKFSHTQAPENYMHIAVDKMAQEVSEKTDGKFTIEVFHSGTLGAEQEIIEGMQLGTIAGNISAANLLGNFVPAYDVFSLPGVFSDEDHIKEVFNNSEIMDPFKQEALDVGIRVEGYFQDYFRQLYTKEKVTDVESLNSMKIRVMGSPYLVDSFNALGANPTTTSWSELYTALQLGIDEGMDHVATSVTTMNFYDHLNYMCEPKLFASPMFLTISQPLYDELPDEYKTVLDEAVQGAIQELNDKGNEMNNDAIEFLQTEGGLEYVEIDPSEFQAATAEVKEKYVDELDDWVKEVLVEIENLK